jgi:hypothetical protein
MRYWGYLAGKLATVAAVVYGLQLLVSNCFPPAVTWYGKVHSLFLWDMAYTFCVLGVWLIGAGLLALAVHDQRRRCRTCLRRLIMPVATGSWGNMLRFGRPKTEWICPFGHGTLRIDELKITGQESPDWQPHDDNIWKELESYYQARK